MRRIGDTYYFVYSSERSHELCYATSRHPDRDFRYGGTLVSIGDIGYRGNTVPVNYTGNTHGGMAEINGDWYIFYHRQTNQQKCARQVCTEKITILPDGSIPQVELTSCGLNGGPLPAAGTYEARIACNLSGKNGIFPYLKTREKDKKRRHPYFTQSGEDREKDGDQYIANMTDGAWCGFKYFNFDGGELLIKTRVRGTATGCMRVYTDRWKAETACIEVAPSGEYLDFEAELTVTAGIHPLYFRYEGSGSLDFAEFTFRKRTV